VAAAAVGRLVGPLASADEDQPLDKERKKKGVP